MTAKPFCDGPFRAMEGSGWIVGKDKHGDDCHVLDQRGWGYLTGFGHSALGLDTATASQMQADMQQWVVDAMNDAWNRRADLAAVQPAQVRVKPLVWHEGDEPDEWKSGPYDVWCELGKFQVYHWSIVKGAPHETAEAAKAEAQADYEARILAALEPQPDPRDEQRRALEKVIRNQRVQIKRLAATAEAHWRFVNRVREERLADPRDEVIARLVEALELFSKMEFFVESSDDTDPCIISAGTVRRCRTALAAAKAVQHG